MRYINKVLTYFNSSYTNSTRYNSHISNLLRILFERNNKVKSTVSNLGNVFKNSKWTDFKTQNIKESLIKEWVFVFLLFLFIFLSYSILLGLSGNNSLIRSIPFVNKLIEVFMEVWVPFTNYIDYIAMCIGSYYFFFMFNARSKFFNEQARLIDTVILDSKSGTKKFKSQQDLNIKAAYGSNTTSNNETLKSLTTTNGELNLVSADYNDFKTLSTHSDALPLIQNFTTKVWFIVIKNSNSIEHQKSNNLGEANYIPVINDKTLQLTLEPYTIAKIQKNTQFIPSNLNIMSQLSLAKQDRWFLKNSLLSDSLSKSSNNFTQSKNY